jgi:hypothetical protein
MFKHEEKTEVLWKSFKDRLGSSDFSHMYFDLYEFLHHTEN